MTTKEKLQALQVYVRTTLENMDGLKSPHNLGRIFKMIKTIIKEYDD